MSSLAPLDRFVRKGPAPKERCELCAAAIAEGHGHVVDKVERSIACACPACMVLFRSPEAGGGRFQTVPDRSLRDPSFRIEEARWEEFEIPVRLAFLFRNSLQGRWVAVYPSPAGPTEVTLETEALASVLGESRLFSEVREDVEAILVYGRRGTPFLECLLLPIDRCYELVSIVRRTWEGFDGGGGRREIEAFWEASRDEARDVGGAR